MLLDLVNVKKLLKRWFFLFLFLSLVFISFNRCLFPLFRNNGCFGEKDMVPLFYHLLQHWMWSRVVKRKGGKDGRNWLEYESLKKQKC